MSCLRCGADGKRGAATFGPNLGYPRLSQPIRFTTIASTGGEHGRLWRGCTRGAPAPGTESGRCRRGRDPTAHPGQSADHTERSSRFRPPPSAPTPSSTSCALPRNHAFRPHLSLPSARKRQLSRMGREISSARESGERPLKTAGGRQELQGRCAGSGGEALRMGVRKFKFFLHECCVFLDGRHAPRPRRYIHERPSHHDRAGLT
jgi:hypothetical protein